MSEWFWAIPVTIILVSSHMVAYFHGRITGIRRAGQLLDKAFDDALTDTIRRYTHD